MTVVANSAIMTRKSS